MKFNPFKSDIYCLAVVFILLSGEATLKDLLFARARKEEHILLSHKFLNT